MLDSIFEEKAIILQVKLKLEKGNKSEIENKVKELLAQRKEKQPVSQFLLELADRCENIKP